jgi:glucose-1-phosphate cytidylyltransferase
MKVVLFCGGLGTRLRDYSESVPKPMVPIGYRPILWHVMKYYAHFGHTEFILCLGYRADVIKSYFRTYDESISNDFVLSRGGAEVQLLGSDIGDWKITFIDTGVNALIGERLLAVRDLVAGDDAFLANYADGLTDLDLDAYVRRSLAGPNVATFLAVRPNMTFHFTDISAEGDVRAIRPANESDYWINGGYFVLRPEIFDYMRPGEDLVREPFSRLIDAGRLGAERHYGFWTAMDTFKDKERLDELYAASDSPWELWKRAPRPGEPPRG